MVDKPASICDIDQAYVTKGRDGMVVIGLSNDELHVSFKMSLACFERFYEDLSKFKNQELKGGQ